MRRLLALLILLSLQAGAEVMDFPGYRWDSPLPFGPVQDFGGETYFAVYPDVLDTNQVKLELIVITTPYDSVALIKDSGADPRRVALSTFMDKNDRPEQINKALFMGTTAARQVYTSAQPRPNTTHVFQHFFENGALLTVALRDYGGNEPGAVGEVLRAVSQTFVSTSR